MKDIILWLAPFLVVFVITWLYWELVE